MDDAGGFDNYVMRTPPQELGVTGSRDCCTGVSSDSSGSARSGCFYELGVVIVGVLLIKSLQCTSIERLMVSTRWYLGYLKSVVGVLGAYGLSLEFAHCDRSIHIHSAHRNTRVLCFLLLGIRRRGVKYQILEVSKPRDHSRYAC